MLQDQIAVIDAIERDFEDRIHIAVTILDDPGRDLGAERMPGHRFFFAPVASRGAGMTSCRIAGIALGALVLGIVLSQVPDLIRYVRISSM